MIKPLFGILGPRCNKCGKPSLFQRCDESEFSDNKIEVYQCPGGHIMELPLVENKHDKK